MHRVRYQVSILFLLGNTFVSLTIPTVGLVVVVFNLFPNPFHFLRFRLFWHLLGKFDLIGFLFYFLGRRLLHEVAG